MKILLALLMLLAPSFDAKPDVEKHYIPVAESTPDGRYRTHEEVQASIDSQVRWLARDCEKHTTELIDRGQGRDPTDTDRCVSYWLRKISERLEQVK